MINWEKPSKIAVSRDSAANCRLLMLNERVLCDFSDEKTRKRFSAGENVEKLEAADLDPDDTVTVRKRLPPRGVPRRRYYSARYIRYFFPATICQPFSFVIFFPP